MGYIREPKNVDLVVGPSVLTEADIEAITQAIAKYKKTGEKPTNTKTARSDLAKDITKNGSAKTITVHS